MRIGFCILLLLIYAVGSLATLGQDLRKSTSLQDIVGEWELVESRDGVQTREKLMSGLLRIAVKDNEVSIFRRLEDKTGTTERKFIFFADGRGETNKWTGEDGKTVIERNTKTSWKKGVLSSKWNYKTNFGWMDVEDRYKLSGDLLNLEYEHIQQVSGPFRTAFSGKMVFRRAE